MGYNPNDNPGIFNRGGFGFVFGGRGMGGMRGRQGRRNRQMDSDDDMEMGDYER